MKQIFKEYIKHQIPPQNDGTNVCVFLAISIGDAFMQEIAKENVVTLEKLTRLAEMAITNLPSKINDHRDFSKMYDPSDARLVLEQHKLLGCKECISANSVFLKTARIELIEALTRKQTGGTKSRVGLYTCCPYAFLVGIHDNSYFLIDTRC